MATLIKTDGRVIEIKPLKGPEFTLQELQRIVGGNLEFKDFGEPGKLLVCNEEFLILDLPYNGVATERVKSAERICGDVVIVDRTEVS